MKVLVTGGGGFVGRELVTVLRERGDTVRVLGRGRYPVLEDQGVECQRGDVGDAAAVDKAVQGMDAVCHVAAKVGAAGDYESFHRTNVQGTQHVIDACRKHGVGVLVHTSTPSVIFGHKDLEGVDESEPYPSAYEADYPRTKAEAERLVLAANDDTLRTIALRPHIVWGPGDTSLLPRLLERAPKLRRITGPAKLTDVTYIDDAVRAHVLALDKLSEPEACSACGRAFFITAGEPIEIWTFIDRILAAADGPKISKSAPPKLAMAAGWVFETVHRITKAKGEPRMSRWIVRELTTSHWFNIQAARDEFGYAPKVSIDKGMQRLQAWIRGQESTGMPLQRN